MALPQSDGGRSEARRGRHLSRPDARGARTAIRADLRNAEIRHHWRAPRRVFRHRRLADLADDGLRLGRHRHPARRRSDPPRRMPGGPRGWRRWLADAGIAGALLAALGVVDAKRYAGAGVKTVL